MSGEGTCLVGSDEELAYASERWLMARETFLRSGAANGWDEFRNADCQLFAAFAADWTGSDEALANAYQQFRQILVVEDDWSRLVRWWPRVPCGP